jgi:hypothetical protein
MDWCVLCIHACMQADSQDMHRPQASKHDMHVTWIGRTSRCTCKHADANVDEYQTCHRVTALGYSRRFHRM